MRVLPIVLTLLAIVQPARAQDAPAAGQVQPPATLVEVRLETGEGPILLSLDPDRAPATVGNFLAYVDDGRLDGTTFYRAMKMGEGTGLIQGGTRNDPKRILPPVTHEATSATGLSHEDGAISMARYAPGTATGDFFIILGDMRGLDAQPQAMGDNAGFAVFGRVTRGMDVVRRIFAAPTSPTEGEGVMKGQMLAAPVRIISARRTP